MTCNFFLPSQAHMNQHAHVNTSCLPFFQPSMHPHTSCMPIPTCHPFHNHYDPWHSHCGPHGHHHDTDNTMVINISTPCCPESKPEPQPEPKPKSEPEKPKVDFSKLAVKINPIDGQIMTADTMEPTGQYMTRCINVLNAIKNELELSPRGTLVGGCDNNKSCGECLKAINSSIGDKRPTDSKDPTGVVDKTGKPGPEKGTKPVTEKKPEGTKPGTEVKPDEIQKDSIEVAKEDSVRTSINIDTGSYEYDAQSFEIM